MKFLIPIEENRRYVDKSDIDVCVEECGGCCCKSSFRGSSIYAPFIPVTSNDLEKGTPSYGEMIIEDSGCYRMALAKDGSCIAQDPQKNSCIIYDVRPMYCRLYPFKPAFLRIPATGEHIVWRDRKFRMSDKVGPDRNTLPIVSKDLLHWYEDDNNIIIPMIMLQKCPYSENLSEDERISELKSAADVMKSEKELWRCSLMGSVHGTSEIERLGIYSIEELNKLKEKGIVLGTALITTE